MLLLRLAALGAMHSGRVDSWAEVVVQRMLRRGMGEIRWPRQGLMLWATRSGERQELRGVSGPEEQLSLQYMRRAYPIRPRRRALAPRLRRRRAVPHVCRGGTSCGACAVRAYLGVRARATKREAERLAAAFSRAREALPARTPTFICCLCSRSGLTFYHWLESCRWVGTPECRRVPGHVRDRRDPPEERSISERVDPPKWRIQAPHRLRDADRLLPRGRLCRGRHQVARAFHGSGVSSDTF